MTRQELLAKIRKCLAMSKSANEHEAAAALATVRRLMEQYGVDQADVDLIDAGEYRAKGSCAWTPTRWETLLAVTVARAIPTTAISCGDTGWAFVGLTPNPEIASYAFGTLYRQLKRARTAYMATNLKRVKSPRRKTARADAFCEGWVVAVRVKIEALCPEAEMPEVVRAYIARNFRAVALLPRETAASGAAAENDRDHGWSAGRKVDLNQAVTSTRQELLA
ncbi:DUF2786 domain-containing protein [Sphingobium yanoikuyae]|uniref:DUF2786 domain-containing protein n=1 Tax=Sphingobium yanoikuyae TaxID=13690 RepID=A0A9X7YEC0_SPHYA|nr:DUF2786 domain-containing protein [Sphingobium yanoikuyae]QNG47410.1 DUF2786 domain-containing protein [Sphingobium yanoikuyae]